MSLEDEYNKTKEQRDLLFNGLKKLVRSESTPDNIKTFLNTLAKKVVAVKTSSTTHEIKKAFEVGDIVTTTNNKICRYRIEKLYNEDNTDLCSLRTIWVKDNIAPADGVHNNIPVSLLKHYKGV